MAPAQNRLRRFCGILRTPNGALGSGAMAGLRVVFGHGWSRSWLGSKTGKFCDESSFFGERVQDIFSGIRELAKKGRGEWVMGQNVDFSKIAFLRFWRTGFRQGSKVWPGPGQNFC